MDIKMANLSCNNDICNSIIKKFEIEDLTKQDLWIWLRFWDKK